MDVAAIGCSRRRHVTWLLAVALLGLTAAAACGGDGRATVRANDEPALMPSCDELTPEPEIDGPLSDDPEVAMAQRGRAQFGPPSDEASTRAALDHPGPDELADPGMPLTEAEARQWFSDMEIGAPGFDAMFAEVMAYVDGQADYAGKWGDRPNSPSLVFGFSGDLGPHQAALDAIIGSEFTFKVKRVERSLADMKAIIADSHALIDDGTAAFLGDDEVLNRVDAALIATDRASIARASEVLPVDAACWSLHQEFSSGSEVIN